jgi:hypothetical protein
MEHTIRISAIPDGLSAADFVKNDKVVDALSHLEYQLVAVLDVGAYFRDQKNEQVAAGLLNLQKSVLYFSTDKNKSALITEADPNEKLIHTYSDDIIKELVPDERQRITFYDQQHNTGVDIFQHVNGSALIIIGVKTTSIDFHQSVFWRPRDSSSLFLSTQMIAAVLRSFLKMRSTKEFWICGSKIPPVVFVC